MPNMYFQKRLRVLRLIPWRQTTVLKALMSIQVGSLAAVFQRGAPILR